MSLFQQKGVGLSHIDKISSHSIASSIQTAIEVLEDGGWRDTKVKVIKQTTRHAASSGSTSEIGRGRRTPNKVKQKIQLSKLPRRKGEKMNWFKRTSTHPVDRDLSYDEFRTFLLEVSVKSSDCDGPEGSFVKMTACWWESYRAI